jgi:2-polyprenyl-3-methyl-5-hydroxy-6-metoxy-1,4-benzoquinol methylase
MCDAAEYLHSRLFANWETQTRLDPIEIRNFRQGLDRLRQFSALGSLLDVGCGRGLFLKLARQDGWRAVGSRCHGIHPSLGEGVLGSK